MNQRRLRRDDVEIEQKGGREGRKDKGNWEEGEQEGKDRENVQIVK